MLLCSGVDATDYFVRTTGDDAADGLTTATAWQTPAHAASQLAGGDTVYIGGGVYEGEVAPAQSGTAADPIRYIADTAGTMTGDAGTVTLRRAGRVIYLNGVDYHTFSGFTINHTAPSGRLVVNKNSSGVVLENCYFFGGTVQGTPGGGTGYLQVNGGSVSISRCTFDNLTFQAIEIEVGAADITDCMIRTVSTKYDYGAIRFGSGGLSSGTIDRTTILSAYYGIRLYRGTLSVSNSVFADEVRQGINVQGNADLLTVTNCTFDGFPVAAINAAGTSTVDISNSIFSNMEKDAIVSWHSSVITASNNLYYNIAGELCDDCTHSQWIVADPMYTDAAAGDFALQQISPAINGGVDASAVTSVDRNNDPRPAAGGFDIGAFEFQGRPVIAGDLPYAMDFENGIDYAWTEIDTETQADFTAFSGRFTDAGSDDQSTTLWVNTEPGSKYRLSFDLYVIDDWDGDAGAGNGDFFDVSAGGTLLFHETFDQNAGQNGQTYAGEPERNENFAYGPEPDSIYRAITLDFTGIDARTALKFQGVLTATDKSWGIDNITVAEVPKLFVDATAASGFGFNANSSLHSGGGWAWADFDGDGDLDAVLSSASAKRFINDGDGTFTVSDLGNYTRAVALLDLENDGDADFFTSRSESFFENTGGMAFIQQGALGAASPYNNEGVAGADVDGDGLCDLVMFSGNGNFICLNKGPNYQGITPTGFEETNAAEYGLNDSGDYGNGDYVSSADVNNDGHMDFFYHYGNNSKLFLSNADGTFTQDNRGISAYTNNSYKIGSCWGDYDNDGDMDLFAPEGRNWATGNLFRNDNDGAVFLSITNAAGLNQVSAQRSGAWGDCDNDGDLDLYITTASGTPNILCLNNGDGTFTRDDTAGAALGGDHQDAVFVDYDNDGDLDLTVNTIAGDTVLLQNSTDNSNFLKVRIIGKGTGGTNMLGIGTRVELWNAAGTGRLGTREVGVSRGYGGVEPMWLHFGGVEPTKLYTLKIRFPGQSEFRELAVTPGTVSTTIGGTTIAQMATIDEAKLQTAIQVVKWEELGTTAD